MPKLAHELRMLNPIVNFESYKGTRILVSLNLEEFGLQNQQSLDGKRFYMDAGESHMHAIISKSSPLLLS